MSGPLSFIATFILFGVSMYLSTVRSGMLALNHYQLKLRAQKGEKNAKIAYPLHVLRYQLFVVTSLLSFIVYAVIILILREAVGGLLTVIISSLALLLFAELLPLLFLRNKALSLVVLTAPFLKKLLGALGSILRPVARKIEVIMTNDENKLVTREQLIAMFENTQKTASDVSNDELNMLKGALSFSDKLVRDVMTPRRMVTVVSADDDIGPLVMDELHRSGHSRFPVTSSSEQTDFVGTLYLRELVGQKSLRKVRDIMSEDVRYIHEEQSLDYALRTFLKTKHHLFVVVNNFEEFVGVLSIEDVLEEIIGHEIVDEFDAHDDLRAVAASVANKERAKREKQANQLK